MSKTHKSYIATISLFVLFIIYTVLVKTVDVQPVGPEDTEIGFAGINMAVFSYFGESDFWYLVTKYLGVFAIVVVLGFAVVGVKQMIQRKNLFRTDLQLLVLGGFYVVMAVFYRLFEKVIINYRPVLEDGQLAASYPSSHTMLVCCVMATAIMQFNRMIKNQTLCIFADIAAVAVIALMVLGRLLSGVHWLTDIIGGVIISAALVMLYVSVMRMLRDKIRGKRKQERLERKQS